MSGHWEQEMSDGFFISAQYHFWGFWFCGCAPVISVYFLAFLFPSLCYAVFLETALSQGMSRGLACSLVKSTFSCVPSIRAGPLTAQQICLLFGALEPSKLQDSADQDEGVTELAHRHGLFSPQSLKNLEG